jgi:polysaccharide deacetylase family protein (PEP-CTERM system associated)
MKYAVLTMDIEDWYHLDYIDSFQSNKNYSLLDGVDVYCQILDDYNIPSSFFVVSEIAKSISSTLNTLVNQKHEIACHGPDHIRPANITPNKFYNELKKSKIIIEDLTGTSIEGYRAPCFSIDRPKLDLVKKAEFLYDSSRINFTAHPLYETLNMDGYETVKNNIFRLNKFFEFELSTLPIFGKNIPVSGGGYLRLLPWGISKRLIKSYLSKNEIYILYLHPFELSKKMNPNFPINTSFGNRLRFKTGRKSVSKKLIKLINLLKNNEYSFTTFSLLRKELLKK